MVDSPQMVKDKGSVIEHQPLAWKECVTKTMEYQGSQTRSFVYSMIGKDSRGTMGRQIAQWPHIFSLVFAASYPKSNLFIFQSVVLQDGASLCKHQAE